jgi:prepilin-type N-terminal cleavage/methylation domain-containing protein
MPVRSRLRRGVTLFELLVALLAGASVFALSYWVLRGLETGELPGRAAPQQLRP